MVLRYAGLLLLLSSAGGASVAQAQDLTNLTGIASLTGTCERIVMAGHDFSQGCAGKIMQSTYSTGRTGFYVMLGENGTTATFSGIQGAKPDPDSQLQSVDKVIFNLGIEGVPPTTKETTGSCAYSNPYKGPMTISCSAVDSDGGAYLLQFRTDGSEPKFADLQSKPPEDETTVSDAGGFEVVVPRAFASGRRIKFENGSGATMMSEDEQITFRQYAAATNKAPLDFLRETSGEGEILEKASYPNGAVIMGRLGSADSFVAACRNGTRGLQCIDVVFATEAEPTVGAQAATVAGDFLRAD